MRRVLARIFGALRDAWSILGVTLLLLLAMEGAYRAQAAVRRALRAARAPEVRVATHPNAEKAWWLDIRSGRNDARGGALAYDPFRGWWPLPLTSRHMNADSLGRRVTVQPPLGNGERRRVFLFGGSVMWGWIVPDSSTIPSRVAGRLREMGYDDLEVVNLAQSMYDLAQNTATLLVELRQGRVPAVAVFLDGNNEIAPPYQSGRVGSVLNQQLIARRFDRSESATAGAALLLRSSALVRRLTQSSADASRQGSAALCPAIAASYERQLRTIDGVASAYGFVPMYFWQPMFATSGKKPSAWERSIPHEQAWTEMVRRCTGLVDSLLVERHGKNYFPLHHVFDDDSTTVFVDDFGHVTERGNDIIAAHITERIAERLGRRPAPHH